MIDLTDFQSKSYNALNDFVRDIIEYADKIKDSDDRLYVELKIKVLANKLDDINDIGVNALKAAKDE